MPIPRSDGSAQVTFLPLMKICPPEMSRIPAMQFRSVDFPQPEEPRKTRNSPSPTSRFRVFSTSSAPKLSLRSFTWTE